MVVDNLATQEGMASPAMVLSYFTQNISVSEPEGWHVINVPTTCQ